jgi:CheY-like chemotaxis protein
LVILLAEDDASVRTFAGKLLKMEGFTVLTAGDGKAALEASRKYPGTIDLLLSDVEMPRMGGLDLCRNITIERPGIKVLLMSGHSRTRDQVCKQGLPFLQKPFTRMALRVDPPLPEAQGNATCGFFPLNSFFPSPRTRCRA